MTFRATAPGARAESFKLANTRWAVGLNGVRFSDVTFGGWGLSMKDLKVVPAATAFEPSTGGLYHVSCTIAFGPRNEFSLGDMTLRLMYDDNQSSVMTTLAFNQWMGGNSCSVAATVYLDPDVEGFVYVEVENLGDEDVDASQDLMHWRAVKMN